MLHISIGANRQLTHRNQVYNHKPYRQRLEFPYASRELGTVEAIGQDGQMRMKMDGGRDVQLDSREHPHLDHGYAVTSHSSQGQTAERVLIHVDTELGAKDLLNSRMAYVAVSRGAEDAQIYTNDRAKLPEALGHDVSNESAHTPTIKPSRRSSRRLRPS